jgi:hypothetical protein
MSELKELSLRVLLKKIPAPFASISKGEPLIRL